MKQTIKQAFDPIRANRDLLARTQDKLAAANGRAGSPSRRRRLFKPVLAIAAAIVLLASIFTVAGLSLISTTVAAVSVDINPSIVLELNALNHVIDAQAFNAEGTALLKTLDLQNIPVKAAVGKIVSAAAKAGYLTKDGSSIIAITTSTDSARRQKNLEKDTDAAAQDALQANGNQAVVFHDNTALARIAEARKLGITPGRLNLIQKLIALDPTKKVSDYLEAKASDIMKEVVQLRKAKQNADKTDAKATRESEKEAGQAARESEKEAREATRESVKEARQSEKTAVTQSTAGALPTATTTVPEIPSTRITVAGPNTNASVDSALDRIEQALTKSSENQVQNKG